MTHTKGKITLISVDEYGPSMGIRFLSAALKAAGYETTVIFALGAVTEKVALGEISAFSEEVHQKIAELAAESLYIGISVVTSTFHKAREITEKLKTKLNTPIIWGGVHATVKPEECLSVADMVCVGEGENLVVTLADKLRDNQPYHSVSGLLLSKQLQKDIPSAAITIDISQIAKNATIAPQTPHHDNEPHTDLDSVDITYLPHPDYTFDGSHYLANPQAINKFTPQSYREILFLNYYLAPTRGCPYKCTYCVNNKYAKIYKDADIKRFRKRDLDNVIEELKWAKQYIPNLERIIIDDDCFMAIKESEIRYFAEEYKKHIGLPFVIRGAHPQNLTETKLKVLCEAGLIKLRVGIQTGSEYIRQVYERTWESNEKLLNMSNMINGFIQQKLLHYVMFDVIVDNPWETTEDKYQTLDLLLNLPRPFGLYCFSLTFYPGTDIYDKALEEGIIEDSTTSGAYWQQYWELKPTAINQTLELMINLPLPSSILRFLAKENWLATRCRHLIGYLVRLLPELGLFYKTQLRYEADFFFSVKNSNRKAAQVEFQAEMDHVAPRSLLWIRRLLSYLYVQFLAPRQRFIEPIVQEQLSTEKI